MWGIIPARAGFTGDAPRGADPGADHPRSRGVYPCREPSSLLSSGSSPLARGLLWELAPLLTAHRIIPARAGFTPPGRACTAGGRDHPRSRGVYCPTAARRARMSGSSPLARGLPASALHRALGPGIIPARAGFTLASHVGATRHRDHPRSRGVYGIARVQASARAGSSPLARGLPTMEPIITTAMRIIPARAGFTPSRRPGSVRPADHPRSRGVYGSPGGAGSGSSGSSPLARGLHDWWELEYAYFRIIPARAGFTRPGARLRHQAADHPRSRGVYWSRPRSPGGRSGSSPLARGLPDSVRL